VCAGDFDPSTEWYSEVASQGMPTECIVWGIGERFIIERNGVKRQTFDVPEGVPYTGGEIVCIRIRDGLVSFYVADPDNLSDAPRLFACVPSPKNATLRPFVAVWGNSHRCTVITSSAFTKKEDKGAAGVYVCLLCACMPACAFSLLQRFLEAYEWGDLYACVRASVCLHRYICNIAVFRLLWGHSLKLNS
jgi:hypothetical protein